jgi:hypothetical protein
MHPSHSSAKKNTKRTQKKKQSSHLAHSSSTNVQNVWPRKKKLDEKNLNMPISLYKMVSAQHFVTGY